MRKPHPQQSEKPTAAIKTKPFTKLTITKEPKIGTIVQIQTS